MEDATHAELVGMIKRNRREMEQKDLKMADLMKQVVHMSERLSALELAKTAPILTMPVTTQTYCILTDSIPIVTIPNVTFSSMWRGSRMAVPSSYF